MIKGTDDIGTAGAEGLIGFITGGAYQSRRRPRNGVGGGTLARSVHC